MAFGYCGIIVGSILAGLVYIIIAIIIHFAGTKWVSKLMPPVIIGPTVALIGLSLAGNAMGDIVKASGDLVNTQEKIYDAVEKYTVFGRVTPKQKKLFVTALKDHGRTVGMTGDGVNDVMALKEADCSIAMASGSEASRNVAQLVLLDSDFASLPSVVAEGRRVINNIERAASLFLVKTTFSVVLSLILIILGLAYPFEPIQLTLISGLFVGIPSFFLAIEPNDAKVTGSFLGKVFNKALPSGLTVAVMVTIIGVVYRDVGIDVSAQVSTMSFYVTSLVSFITLLWVCMPYNKERLYLLAMCVVVYIAAVSATFVRDILSLAALTTEMTWNIVFILLAVFPMIVVMRAEIEAVKKLCKDVWAFFGRVAAAIPGHEKRAKRRQEKSVRTYFPILISSSRTVLAV